MSQRESGYERIERDLYETPEWATLALLPHLPRQPTAIWEPAAASGKMVRALESSGAYVLGSDIDQGCDFMEAKSLPEGSHWDAIITNPPYVIAPKFIWQALVLTRDTAGFVAMLLRTDFDHAKTRDYLFDRAQFAKKIVLRKRIQWFEDSKGSPSFNHAWFIWDWQHKGAPTLAYGP
jgi:hypothetical protein